MRVETFEHISLLSNFDGVRIVPVRDDKKKRISKDPLTALPGDDAA